MRYKRQYTSCKICVLTIAMIMIEYILIRMHYFLKIFSIEL